jgi:hypothetical protein
LFTHAPYVFLPDIIEQGTGIASSGAKLVSLAFYQRLPHEYVARDDVLKAIY